MEEEKDKTVCQLNCLSDQVPLPNTRQRIMQQRKAREREKNQVRTVTVTHSQVS